MIPEIYRKGRFIEVESRLEVIRGWGEGEMGDYCLMGTAFLIGVKKVFWK